MKLIYKQSKMVLGKMFYNTLYEVGDGKKYLLEQSNELSPKTISLYITKTKVMKLLKIWGKEDLIEK